MRRTLLVIALCSVVLAAGGAAADTFSVTLVSQTTNTITLGWAPQPGYGYLFSVDGTVVSRTNDPSRSSVKFQKGGSSYEIAVIVKGSTGTYPPSPPPPPAAACADTVDNDADGKIDYPADPGCSSLADTNETDPTPPPPPTQALTGVHWANSNEYSTLKQAGYQFAVANVAPGDMVGAKERLDAADAAGIKLILGLYAFGGPEPYVLKADGTWTITAAAVQSIDYFESRQSSIIAMFGFNEPYWVGPDGHTDTCGVFSAANLRQLRTQIRAIWPGAKIYHDIGWPSEWAPGGDLYNAYSCIGNKYADATGVADYVGVWDYPFTTSGYTKASALARLQKETSYVTGKMGAIPVWLGQAHSTPEFGLVWPTDAQLKDWNCSFRPLLPSGSLVSWYVWRQNIYTDYLVNHPAQWPLTLPGACA